jgi:hypothetical protein
VGLAEAQELIKRADIVIHNFPPSNSKKFGLDYEAVKNLNPDAIYCSITGFGSGVGAVMPGYDLLVQAMGGLMSVTGPAPGEPTKVGVALVDVITGMHATIGLLAALMAANERSTKSSSNLFSVIGDLHSRYRDPPLGLKRGLVADLLIQVRQGLLVGINPGEHFCTPNRDVVV